MNIKLNRTLVKPLFLAATVAMSPTLTQQAVADGGGAYSGYDANQDGYLDRNEFKPFADTRQKRSASPELWNFNRMDADGDGAVRLEGHVQPLASYPNRRW